MKCPHCHSDNPDTSRFCANCAAPLRGETGASTAFTRTMTAKVQPLEKGTLFTKKYRIIGKIGQGGMGVVFKAEDTRLKRLVALKLLPSELSFSSEAKERFIREAQAAAALDHPNICTVYEVEEQDGQAYIAMAYVEGISLKDKIAQGVLSIEEVLGIAIQIASGLEEAHHKGIIHRDIKPANIMLALNGQIKIMDFGLARLEGAVELTRSEIIMGTVAYMSPEQALGKKVSHHTDIWSFGCLVYEMLAGKAPFQGGNEQAVFQAILQGEFQPIAAVRSDIPVDIDKILGRCLKINLLDRYQNTGDLGSDLRSVDIGNTAAFSEVPVHKQIPSIAVLPFSDMSPGRDQGYFGEGIAEELINALAHIKDLRVVARTSAFALKGKSLDVREIGHMLSVKVILEGSVRIASQRLRVTAQLINVEDGFHLWSERFDREMDDVLTIQDEIAQAIVENLKITLLMGEKTAIQKRLTADPEAYNLYLKGLYFFYRPSTEAYTKALNFFRDSINKDPNFALAYAGMANVFGAQGIMNLAPPAEMWPKAKAALQKALSLDEDLAEAYAVSAQIQFWYDWDWDTAGRSFDRVLTLNPGDAMSHGTYAWFLLNRKRFDEALQEIKQALRIDPLMPLYYAWSVGLSLAVGKPDEALKEFARAVELDPNNGLAYFHAGMAYIRKGLLDEAMDTFKKGKKLVVFPGWIEGNLGMVYFRTGDRKKAEQILDEMIEKKKKIKNLSSVCIAWLSGILGKLDQSFLFLDKAYAERDTLMAFIHIYTEWFCPEIIRDPRYKKVLIRMQVPS